MIKAQNAEQMEHKRTAHAPRHENDHIKCISYNFQWGRQKRGAQYVCADFAGQ